MTSQEGCIRCPSCDQLLSNDAKSCVVCKNTIDPRENFVQSFQSNLATNLFRGFKELKAERVKQKKEQEEG